MRPPNSYNGMMEGEDFIIHPHPQNKEWNAVTFLRKPYVGVIIEYGKLTFGSENKLNGTIDCQFDYEILDSQKYTKKELQQSQDFQKFAGDVLMEILWSQIGDLDEFTRPRNNNT